MYYGILEEFYLDEQGALDRLVLTSASRRKIEADQPKQTADESAQADDSGRFYPIKGDRLILKYEHTKNLNIEYLLVEEK